jgi:hypothetical protein
VTGPNGARLVPVATAPVAAAECNETRVSLRSSVMKLGIHVLVTGARRSVIAVRIAALLNGP